MIRAPDATIDQSLIPNFRTFLQERQEFLRNINKPTDIEIKFNITKQNIHEKKATTIGQIDNNKSLTPQQKKIYKSFIDSLKDVTMNNEGELHATAINEPKLNTEEYKELAIYLSRNFDERDCPHNKFFAELVWEKYEQKMKENNTYFNSNLDKIKNLPQYKSVALTYEELKASWLELQYLSYSIPYSEQDSREKLSYDNFDSKKERLIKMINDDQIDQRIKGNLLRFVKDFKKDAVGNKKYFTHDKFYPNLEENFVKQNFSHNDLKEITNQLKKYTLSDPQNYGIEDNWGGFNTYVFKNAFYFYFEKLKDDGIAKQEDIDKLRTKFPSPRFKIEELIRKQRKYFADELSNQQTTPLVSDNKVITDNTTLKTEIDSFRAEFTKEKYKDFDDLGLDKNIVSEIISSNTALNPYHSEGGLDVVFSGADNTLNKLRPLDCLKVAKYFLKKSKDESESLHEDKDGSKKIQINTYLARVFFWLYEEKLRLGNFVTKNDLDQLQTDIPFEHIGTPSKSKDNNSYSETDIVSQREKFTDFWNLKILSMPPQTEKGRIPFKAQDISGKIEAIISETYRDTQISHNNRPKFKSFLTQVKSLQNHQLKISNDNIKIEQDDIEKFDRCSLSSGDLYTIAIHFLKKSNSEKMERSDEKKTIGENTYLSFLAFSLYEEKLKNETRKSSNYWENLKEQYPFNFNNPQNQTSTTSPTTKDHSEITNLLKSEISKDNTNEFTRFFTNILNYDIYIDKALNEIYREEKNREKLQDFLQESDSKLAINLRKYILNKYDNIFDIESNRHSLSELKTWSAHGVFNTDTVIGRYDKHDLENAKNHLATVEQVSDFVSDKKNRFARDSGGILSLPPSPFSTKAVVKQIFSSSRERK